MDEVRFILPEKKAGRLHILAAVSGGADSVAMLALLKEAAGRRSFTLTAAHFEHGIRAEDSFADAAFVRALCGEWGIPLIEGQADVPALAKACSVGLETAARQARYDFLMNAREQAGADYIALAHHRDDQAETVLMHLLRGCGLRGAAGMKTQDGVLYRPLLDIPKETLVGYLQNRGIPWREDATNAVADNPRNALRLNVMPEIERIYPGAKGAVCRFSEIAAEEDAFMQRAVSSFLDGRCVKLPFGWLIGRESVSQPWEDVRVLLMRAVNGLTGVSREAAVRAVSLAEQTDRVQSVQLENGWTAERGGRGLYLIREDWAGLCEKPLILSDCMRLEGGLGTLAAAKGRGIPIRDNPFAQELNADALEGAVVRTRRDGDFIHPLGAPGRQKLSDYFINRKIDRPLRDIVPLIARGSEVLWVMGVGISEKARLYEGARAVRLELTDWPLQKFGGQSNA